MTLKLSRIVESCLTPQTWAITFHQVNWDVPNIPFPEKTADQAHVHRPLRKVEAIVDDPVGCLDLLGYHIDDDT